MPEPAPPPMVPEELKRPPMAHMQQPKELRQYVYNPPEKPRGGKPKPRLSRAQKAALAEQQAREAAAGGGAGAAAAPHAAPYAAYAGAREEAGGVVGVGPPATGPGSYTAAEAAVAAGASVHPYGEHYVPQPEYPATAYQATAAYQQGAPPAMADGGPAHSVIQLEV